MLSVNHSYVQERVHRYNAADIDDFPTRDSLLYRIGTHADALDPHTVVEIDRRNDYLLPEERYKVLDWILAQGYEIKGDLALLIFGREQLTKWLEISRQAYPDFEFYLVFEYQDSEDSGWDSGINYSVFWHPTNDAPMPVSDCDFPWRLFWECGGMFWGDFPDNTKNDIEFTLSVYPNQQAFADPGWFCEEGESVALLRFADRYCSFTDDEEADLMPVAEVLRLFA